MKITNKTHDSASALNAEIFELTDTAHAAAVAVATGVLPELRLLPGAKRQVVFQLPSR